MTYTTFWCFEIWGLWKKMIICPDFIGLWHRLVPWLMTNWKGIHSTHFYPELIQFAKRNPRNMQIPIHHGPTNHPEGYVVSGWLKWDRRMIHGLPVIKRGTGTFIRLPIACCKQDSCDWKPLGSNSWFDTYRCVGSDMIVDITIKRAIVYSMSLHIYIYINIYIYIYIYIYIILYRF